MTPDAPPPDGMSASDVQRWTDDLAERFTEEAERLGQLDAVAGDGDHGAAMSRGFRAAAKAARTFRGDDVGELLITAGRAFMSAAAGASGPLVASVFLELGKASRGRPTMDAASVADGLAGAVALVRRMGRSEPGDKTMLDALAPAAEAATQERGTSLVEALRHAAAAAQAGRDRTRDLPARRGRAHWVEGAGIGHLDPGATSVALMLDRLRVVATRQGGA